MRLAVHSAPLGCAAAIALACSPEPRPHEDAVRIPAHYNLAQIDGKPLPFADTAFSTRIMSSVLELYTPDSLRIISVARDSFLDHIPCEALRWMAQSPGTGGLGGVSDTSTAGCDELRVVTDTAAVAYAIHGDSITIANVPAASGTLRADTIKLTVHHHIEPAEGPAREWSQLWLYVRRSPSRP